MTVTSGPPRERRHFAAGDVLFREGDRSQFVYRLAEGGVEVTRRGASGDEVVGQVGQGEYLGEIGVLVATRRSGTATFTAAAEVEIFSRDEFLKQAAGDAAIGRPLINVLSLRSRANIARLELDGRELPGADAIRGHNATQFAREALRAWLMPRRLDGRARALLDHPDVRTRTLARGEVLFEQGDPATQVSWIESGRLRVVRHRSGAAHTIGHAWRGEFVGEMGVLESMPRTAAVIAASKVSIRELPPGMFLQLMGVSPKAFITVVESLCERTRRVLEAGPARPSPEALPPMGGFFEAVRSIESVSELAQRRTVDEARRAGRFVTVQVERGKFVSAAYQRYLRGTASAADMERANGYFRDYVKLAGMGTLFMLPGGTITVPLAAKIGQALGVDVFPAAFDD